MPTGTMKPRIAVLSAPAPICNLNPFGDYQVFEFVACRHENANEGQEPTYTKGYRLRNVLGGMPLDITTDQDKISILHAIAFPGLPQLY